MTAPSTNFTPMKIYAGICDSQIHEHAEYSGMTDIKSIHVVYATWCPHCVPTTVEPMRQVAKDLGVPFFSYDIDIPDQMAKADELVRRYGDWSEDYLIPQVFIETKEGKVRHVFTGYSEGVESTRRALNNLLSSLMFAR